MKQLISLLLAAILAFSLCSCSAEKQTETQSSTSKPMSDPSATVLNEFIYSDYLIHNEESTELVFPSESLNPAAIYDNLTYIPEMFYGDYRILGCKEGEEAYADHISYIDFKTEFAEKLTAIPYGLTAGPRNLMHAINASNEHHWLRAYFYTENGYMTTVLCAYTVNGRELTLQPLESFDYDRESGELTYALGDKTLTYEFDFHGMMLKLTYGSESVVMFGNLWPTKDEPAIGIEGYLAEDSPAIPGVYGIHASLHEGKSWFYTKDEANNSNYGSVAMMSSNGLFTMTVPTEDTVTTFQYVYFNCGTDGIILTDGEQIYRYTVSAADWSK